MTLRTTHTYAVLEVSPPAFNEIAQKLQKAGYTAAFHDDPDHDVVIDMHGIAIGLDMAMKPGTTSIETTSILSRRDNQGKVQLRVNDVTVQMDFDKAREVVAMLQGAIEAAVSDQLIFQFLTEKIGLQADAAGSALLDFRELRQGSRFMVLPS